MNERLKRLLEAQARTWEQMKEIRDRADENGLIRGEDEESWTRANANIEKIGNQITDEERVQRLDSIDRSRVSQPPAEQESGEPGDKAGAYRDAFLAWAERGTSDLDAEQRQALREGKVEARALGVGTDSAGGYTVPPGFRNRLVEQMKAYGAVIDVAEVLDTDSGNELEWPTLDDTANVGAILAENTQVTEQDIVVGTASLGAYKYTSKMVRVSLELLQDSAIDTEGLLTRKLAERIARIWNQHFTTGTGTAQPDGVVTSATVGKTGTTGQTTTITWDDLIDLEHSIDPAYRNARSRFMFRDATLASLRKLKDGNSNYIWQPSVQAGVAPTINGRPYVINQDMPAMAASAKSVLYGDFQEAYVVRRVMGIQLVRFGERYMDFGQVGFLSFARADGTLQNASAVKAYANSAT